MRILLHSIRPGPRHRHDLRRRTCRTSRARALAAHTALRAGWGCL